MTNKVGIHPFGHDSALVRFDHDKKEIYGFSLERVTRFKHDFRFCSPLFPLFNVQPETKLILSAHEVSKDIIDHFEHQYKLVKIIKKYKNILKRKDPLKLKYSLELIPDTFKYFYYKKLVEKYKFKIDKVSFENYLAEQFKISNVVYYDHHFAHACNAYYFAPLHFKNDCVVVTLDGQGDNAFSKIFTINSNEPIEQVVSSNDCSIPILYSIFTHLLGFIPSADEGKLEALACYGAMNKEHVLYQILNKSFVIDDRLQIKLVSNTDFPFTSISKDWGAIAAHFKKYLEKMGEKDFSAVMQLFFEEFFLEYIKKIKMKYSAKKMAFSGGAFANVKLNLRIVEEAGLEEIFIFPAMGDDGNPLGSLAYDDFKDGLNIDWLRDIKMPYFGPQFSKKEVEEVLLKNQDKINFQYLGENSYLTLAKDLTDNKICALFQGKMEFGPRALGHRSIIANPRNPDVRDAINMKFKQREWFQPFCPSILEEERSRLFSISYPNKHMTCAFTMKPEFAKDLPAIVHVDNTARAQFVEPSDDLYFYNLLKELKRINEYGALLNTSFNIHGKTIVMTPQDAIDDFFACGIDALYIENFKVTRK